jgi:hypothetical protein
MSLIGVASLALIAIGVTMWVDIYRHRDNRPRYLWRTISDWLRILANGVSANEALRLQRIQTEDEPQMIWFEIPISYDRLKSNEACHYEAGEVALCVDNESQWIGGDTRASNGNCLLRWDTAAYAAGTHKLHAILEYGVAPPLITNGPMLTVMLSNRVVSPGTNYKK